MERRPFGKTDMRVGVLGFGGAEIGFEKASADTVARLLGEALDAGLNVIDTAECYLDSEELIGQAVSRAAATTSTCSPSAATPRGPASRTGGPSRCWRASSGASGGSGPIGSTWSSSTAAPRTSSARGT